jgi:hypothetical protein
MCAHAAPEDGDIVVRQETREGRDVYVLHTAAGVDQYLLRTREEAVRQAVTFAKRQGVRAWLAGETREFVPLDDDRVVESVGSVRVHDGDITAENERARRNRSAQSRPARATLK